MTAAPTPPAAPDAAPVPRTLVVGGGSIGARHLRNLHALGGRSLAVVEPDAARRAALADVAPTAFASLDEGLAWGPALVVVASPTHHHAAQALAAARAGCHLFVEKPLAHDAAGVAELAREVAARGLLSLVGCNMRFHPGPALVQALVHAGAVGRPRFARLHTGSWLPGWRPAQDYRASYSASSATGGGVILDCIHEIDLARWYLGEVAEVGCLTATGALGIAAEEVAMLTLRHADGALSSVHLDYLQRTYERGCQVVGDAGTVTWDFRAGCVRLYEADAERWRTWPQPEGWAVNDMYVAELAHLLACLRDGTPTTLPVADGAAVLGVALAAHASAAEGRRVAPRSPAAPGAAGRSAA